MTRALSGFALAVAICAATPLIAYADDAARCTSLAGQWKAAKVAKASSPNLPRAKVWAKTAERDCAKDAHRADGVSEYLQALKILGVTAK